MGPIKRDALYIPIATGKFGGEGDGLSIRRPNRALVLCLREGCGPQNRKSNPAYFRHRFQLPTPPPRLQYPHAPTGAIEESQ